MSEEFYHGEEYLEGRPAPTPTQTWWPKPSLLTEGISDLSDPARDYLNQRRLSLREALNSGWYSFIDSAGLERICIPCYGETWAYWQGRFVGETTNLGAPYVSAFSGGGNPPPKPYLCPPWKRGRSLCQIGDDPECLIIVEGPMDALAAVGASFATVTAIALLGLYPPPEALMWLAKISQTYPRRLLILDRDPKAAKRGPELVTFLAEQGLAVELRFPPSPWKDLADAPDEERLRLVTP